MTADLSKVALYCQGTFDVPNPSSTQSAQMKRAAEDIAASGFGTVLLGQWHVHEDGSVYYNDSPLESVMETLEAIPRILLGQGNVKNVLISFGPFGSDFLAMEQNFDAFTATMETVQTASGIQGYDWDLEDSYDQLSGLLIKLTQWVTSHGLMVTAAPYEEMGFWVEVLEKTMSGGVPTFAWWNLQLYSGVTWFPDWVGGLKDIVANPEAFLVPGYAVHDGATPQGVQSTLTRLHAKYPQIAGGFIWQYEDIVANHYTATQFANAIFKAVGRTAALRT